MPNPNELEQVVSFDWRIWDGDGKLSPSAERGNWQVIFKTEPKPGYILDYCRETKRGDMTKEEIAQWAEAQVLAHNYITHAVIERW